MTKMTYAEKLKDPRWQKLRLKIMERDGFKCQACDSTEKTLHVHHKFYLSGRNPWEYAETVLITLCEKCHESGLIGPYDLNMSEVFEGIAGLSPEVLEAFKSIHEKVGYFGVLTMETLARDGALNPMIEAFDATMAGAYDRGAGKFKQATNENSHD